MPGTKSAGTRGGTPLELAAGTAALRYSRAAVVVPNGTLFGDGVCARIKEELLKEFNFHTIVRLPNGVFAPYTSIPTNILFFDRSGPTREVWYYEQPLPEGRKNYTKTAPIQFEEFAPLIAWWNKREENERAWKVSAAELLANGCNLDRKNPRAKEDITHLPPAQLAADILKKRASHRGDRGQYPQPAHEARRMNHESPKRFNASAAVMMGIPANERSTSKSSSPVMIASASDATAHASTAESLGSRSSGGIGMVGDIATSQMNRAEASTPSAVSPRTVRRAASLARRRTAPNSARRTSLLQSLKLPCCAASASLPGLPPRAVQKRADWYQRPPSRRRRFSLTASTSA